VDKHSVSPPQKDDDWRFRQVAGRNLNRYSVANSVERSATYGPVYFLMTDCMNRRRYSGDAGIQRRQTAFVCWIQGAMRAGCGGYIER
jgi:hypothetical protein